MQNFLRSMGIGFGFLLISSTAPAQSVKTDKELSRHTLPKFITSQNITVEPAALRRGATGKMVITLGVEDTFHIYDPNPGDPFLTATKVTPLKVSGVIFGKPIWPSPKIIKGAKVHEGTVKVTVPFTVKSAATIGKTAFGAKLYAQGCNANTCYPPADFVVWLPVSIKQ
ncbi:MAG: protein-disulfide reductase DsbD domain-containing protein [Armatimonadaceae bacterium]